MWRNHRTSPKTITTPLRRLGMCRRHRAWLCCRLSELIGKLAYGGCFAYAVDTHPPLLHVVCDPAEQWSPQGRSRYCFRREVRWFLHIADCSTLMNWHIYRRETRCSMRSMIWVLVSTPTSEVMNTSSRLSSISSSIFDLPGNCACDFREYALLGAFKPFVKSLFFFLRKETEYTHWCKIEINRLQNYKKHLHSTHSMAVKTVLWMRSPPCLYGCRHGGPIYREVLNFSPTWITR